MVEPAFLRKSHVERITGRSYSSIRRDMLRGEFPKPVQIGPRAVAWRADDVAEWVRTRAPAALPPVARTVPN